MAETVKNVPVMQEMQETQIWSLGEEYPLGKEMAPHSSILARRISWTEEPGGLQSMGLQRVRHDWAYTHTMLYMYTHIQCYSEHNRLNNRLILNTCLIREWNNSKESEDESVTKPGMSDVQQMLRSAAQKRFFQEAPKQADGKANFKSTSPKVRASGYLQAE